MSIVVVKDSDFEEKVLRNTSPVLVDFWASWCNPCKMAEPILEALSEEYKDKLIIVKLDVDQNPNQTQKYDVMSIPTTILFKEGGEVGRQIGFAGRKAYEDLLKKDLE
ncbi:thioredoxin [Candidatus Woesebacteria bacterium RIFCSPHIGHO2_01_FULL_38_10]|uniref:Thioredoxin n=1 Tax=Candidatus Woesebacteria bacterium RIFCSPLOWO2_01_FULL_39_10b TaxID=1802517 RepID=A0A1F8B7I6_9BACT|nr:MAG: thioredoxin [Candidatus Woesebacteria bacterium RIFCSPHIGHO2_01_FULL_38_10]OGM60006.1 MAG: thioredoxin [Candidatus Woesebacteria bacterium RIFCSPLOWO2_01_FULL_39_10b]